jgi:5'(3')-deoxyribonucleotidase
VLADFDSSAGGIKCWNAGFNHPADALDDGARAAKIEFWRSIEGTNFYADLPVMPGAESMLDAARAVAGENLSVLSRVPGADNFIGGAAEQARIAKQKTEWVLSRFGHYFARENIFITAGKKDRQGLNKSDVLIDDRAENIDAWNGAGGAGILFASAADAARKLSMLKNIIS